jgi:hypothetical protein
VNWVAIENAVVAEIKTALVGVAGASVIWRDQTRGRPARPFVTLAWVDVEPAPNTGPIDYYDDTPGAPAGAELTLSTDTIAQARLEVQTYATDMTGDVSAMALALRIMSQLNGIDSVSRLSEVGVGLDNVGRAQSFSDIFQTEHESRAVLTVSCKFVSTATSTLTYVERAGIEVQLNSNGSPFSNRTFDVPNP